MHRIPALAETGIRKFYNGPESFTPDNQFLLGEAPGAARLLRRRRLQLGRHRLGRRRRPGAGRVDRRGRADQRPGRRRPPPVRAASTRNNRVAARPGRGGARAALRGAVAEPRAGDRAAVPLLARCTTGSPRAGRVVRLEDGLGAAERLRARRASADARRTRWGKPPWLRLVGRRAARHPRGGRGLRPDVVLQVRRRRARRARGRAAVGLRQRRRRRRSGAAVYTPLLNRRGHLRGRPDRHPGRPTTSSCWSAARRPRCATWTGSGGTCPTAATPGSRDVTTAYAVLGVMGPRSRDAARRG